MPRHLTTPSRVLVVISIVLVALVLLLASAVDAAGPDRVGDGPAASAEHVVRSGDSLWAIAAEVTPAGADVRATVETIRALNDIDSSLIVPGQVLKVPVVD